MARFIFFVLLIANVALGAHLYLSPTNNGENSPKEINREAVKIISITDSVRAQKEAVEAKTLVQSLVTAQCMQLSVRPADVARAQTAFAALQLGDRLSSKNIEEFTRFAIALPIQRDRKAADALIANLKKANVKDLLVMADHSISLGLFSSDETARRVVSDLETKIPTLIKGITITAKNPIAKETTFAIRAPDATLIAKVALMQREFEASVLKGVECPNPAGTATALSSPASPSSSTTPAAPTPTNDTATVAPANNPTAPVGKR